MELKKETNDGILNGKEIVYVRSKRTRNAAVPIYFKKVIVNQGASLKKVKQERKLSRTYTFNGEGIAKIPFVMAKVLVSSNINVFDILEPTEEHINNVFLLEKIDEFNDFINKKRGKKKTRGPAKKNKKEVVATEKVVEEEKEIEKKEDDKKKIKISDTVVSKGCSNCGSV